MVTSPLPTSAALQPNISYTRRSNTLKSTTAKSSGGALSISAVRKEKTPENENEDQRFLRLARDALVATAQGINRNSREVVDPTIQDLLTRLQYASSPHGNPISKLEGLEANDAGQLNILGFYQLFPNLSNNIFAAGGEDATTTTTTAAAAADAKVNNRTSVTSGGGGGVVDQTGTRGVSKYNPAGNELGWNFLMGNH